MEAFLKELSTLLKNLNSDGARNDRENDIQTLKKLIETVSDQGKNKSNDPESLQLSYKLRAEAKWSLADLLQIQSSYPTRSDSSEVEDLYSQSGIEFRQIFGEKSLRAYDICIKHAGFLLIQSRFNDAKDILIHSLNRHLNIHGLTSKSFPSKNEESSSNDNKYTSIESVCDIIQSNLGHISEINSTVKGSMNSLCCSLLFLVEALIKSDVGGDVIHDDDNDVSNNSNLQVSLGTDEFKSKDTANKNSSNSPTNIENEQTNLFSVMRMEDVDDDDINNKENKEKTETTLGNLNHNISNQHMILKMKQLTVLLVTILSVLNKMTEEVFSLKDDLNNNTLQSNIIITDDTTTLPASIMSNSIHFATEKWYADGHIHDDVTISDILLLYRWFMTLVIRAHTKAPIATQSNTKSNTNVVTSSSPSSSDALSLIVTSLTHLESIYATAFNKQRLYNYRSSNGNAAGQNTSRHHETNNKIMMLLKYIDTTYRTVIHMYLQLGHISQATQCSQNHVNFLRVSAVTTTNTSGGNDRDTISTTTHIDTSLSTKTTTIPSTSMKTTASIATSSLSTSDAASTITLQQQWQQQMIQLLLADALLQQAECLSIYHHRTATTNTSNINQSFQISSPLSVCYPKPYRESSYYVSSHSNLYLSNSNDDDEYELIVDSSILSLFINSHNNIDNSLLEAVYSDGGNGYDDVESTALALECTQEAYSLLTSVQQQRRKELQDDSCRRKYSVKSSSERKNNNNNDTDVNKNDDNTDNENSHTDDDNNNNDSDSDDEESDEVIYHRMKREEQLNMQTYMENTKIIHSLLLQAALLSHQSDSITISGIDNNNSNIDNSKTKEQLLLQAKNSLKDMLVASERPLYVLPSSKHVLISIYTALSQICCKLALLKQHQHEQKIQKQQISLMSTFTLLLSSSSLLPSDIATEYEESLSFNQYCIMLLAKSQNNNSSSDNNNVTDQQQQKRSNTGNINMGDVYYLKGIICLYTSTSNSNNNSATAATNSSTSEEESVLLKESEESFRTALEIYKLMIDNNTNSNSTTNQTDIITTTNNTITTDIMAASISPSPLLSLSSSVRGTKQSTSPEKAETESFSNNINSNNDSSNSNNNNSIDVTPRNSFNKTVDKITNTTKTNNKSSAVSLSSSSLSSSLKPDALALATTSPVSVAVAECIAQLAYVSNIKGEVEKAKQNCSEVIRMYTKLIADVSKGATNSSNNSKDDKTVDSTTAQQQSPSLFSLSLAKAHFNLAALYDNNDELVVAEKHYNMALHILQTQIQSIHPLMVECMWGLSCVAESQGRADDAAELQREAQRIQQTLTRGGGTAAGGGSSSSSSKRLLHQQYHHQRQIVVTSSPQNLVDNNNSDHNRNMTSFSSSLDASESKNKNNDNSSSNKTDADNIRYKYLNDISLTNTMITETNNSGSGGNICRMM